MFTVENFIKGLNAAGILTEEKDEMLTLSRKIEFFNINDEQEERVESLGEMSLMEIDNLCEELCDAPTDFKHNGSPLWTNKMFEIAVKPHRFIFTGLSDRILYETSNHEHNFSISVPSPKYLLFIICHYAKNNNNEFDLCQFIRPREPITSLETLFNMFNRLNTAKISSQKDHNLNEFNRMLNSYLFNISYNRDVIYSIMDFSDDGTNFNPRARRNGELFPYKSYNQELTKYYHQAIANNIPFTKYLAFYHVAEYYFQTISKQDVFQEIENFITHPSFSPYNKKNISDFYELMRKKIREQRDGGVWSDETGLLLCLKKYVPNINSLKVSIDSIDSTAIDYYKTTFVDFADNGKTIDFDNADTVYNEIRDRVYSVRNSIVHSKDGDKLRYEPFKNDKALAKEIPLIRGIAEEIIVNSAKPFDAKFYQIKNDES